MKLRFNLENLRRKMEQQNDTSYSWLDIANRVDLHRNTVYKLANGDARRVNLDTLQTILTYFEKQGWDPDMNDLFTVTDADAGE